MSIMHKFLNNCIYIGLFAACCLNVYGATKPFVYDTATGNATAVNKLYRDFYIFVDMDPSPQFSNLYQANPSVTNKFYYLDSSGSPKQTVTSTGETMSNYIDSNSYYNQTYWTDFEIKVIDKYGNTLYFSSTFSLNSQSGGVNGHDSSIVDMTPQIFYLPAVASSESTDGCFALKTKFTDYLTSSIFVASVGRCTAVWFYPSLNSTDVREYPNYTGLKTSSGTYSITFGNYIRNIFTNPENMIIVWRHRQNLGEMFGTTPSANIKAWKVKHPVYYGDFKVKTD